MHLHTKFGISTSNNVEDMHQTRLFLETRSEVNVKVQLTKNDMLHSASKDSFTHQIWDSYLKQCSTIIIETRSDIKVTVTLKYYLTLRHPKLHSHTKLGILTSNNIGNMHQTQCGTDRHYRRSV